MHTLTYATPPRWLTYQTAPKYCGISTRTLQSYESAGLIVVANVIQPGSRRGRKLIDRESLDRLIIESVGVKTKVEICPKSETHKTQIISPL
jgi:hypothetical protein